jgi:predicted homoserine dehydrogenase-like protein
MRAERLLPIGLSEGCKIQRAVARDRVVSWDDVEPPAGRMSHRLYEEQVELFT